MQPAGRDPVQPVAIPHRSGAARRIAILGGSTPFTAGLLDAMAADPTWPRGGEIVLYGRRIDVMRLLEAYGGHRLAADGWTVAWTSDLDDALSGASLILHQIRYGGLEGRRDDELLARRIDCPADETLGPGGLQAALRMAPPLRQLADAVRRTAPDAIVLNLTNPLSCATALLARSGLRCVGLCELPELTVETACSALDVGPEEVEWEYAGLNHRGFVHRLAVRDRDLLDELVAILGETGTIEGITAAEIAALHALPLKYFALFRTPPPPTNARTDFLIGAREAILDDLRRDPRRTPPSLAQRYMAWYPKSVVPVVVSLCSDGPRRHVVDVACTDGLVRETKVEISSSGIAPCPPRPGLALPAEVDGWLERFERHERAVLDAVGEPSQDAVRTALSVDSLVPPERVEEAAAAIWSYAVKNGLAA